tara:strand:+ start:43 stop:720 length:678 start_codon:yes stop_codon:yes gene_type:complete
MLSVIIPCFNEQDIVYESLEKIFNYFKTVDFDFEIIVVDNASTDDTKNVLKNIKKEVDITILDEPNKGKGNAVKKGLQNIKFEKVLILDADLSTDINEFKNEWLEVDNTIFLGSRYYGIEIDTPYLRKVSGSILNLLIRIFFGIKVKDTQCGFKYLSSDKISKISNEMTIRGFMYDLDLILICKENNLKIEEIPVKYIFNDHSSVSLIRDPFFMIKDLLRLKNKF